MAGREPLCQPAQRFPGDRLACTQRASSPDPRAHAVRIWRPRLTSCFFLPSPQGQAGGGRLRQLLARPLPRADGALRLCYLFVCSIDGGGRGSVVGLAGCCTPLLAPPRSCCVLLCFFPAPPPTRPAHNSPRSSLSATRPAAATSSAPMEASATPTCACACGCSCHASRYAAAKRVPPLGAGTTRSPPAAPAWAQGRWRCSSSRTSPPPASSRRRAGAGAAQLAAPLLLLLLWWMLHHSSPSSGPTPQRAAAACMARRWPPRQLVFLHVTCFPCRSWRATTTTLCPC